MPGPDDAPRTPRLPDSAPQALREFVACRSMSVRLDTDELGWIPVPDGVPASGAPDVTVQPGSTPTTATLRVGYGLPWGGRKRTRGRGPLVGSIPRAPATRAWSWRCV